jgi:hypothetical protein
MVGAWTINTYIVRLFGKFVRQILGAIYLLIRKILDEREKNKLYNLLGKNSRKASVLSLCGSRPPVGVMRASGSAVFVGWESI